MRRLELGRLSADGAYGLRISSPGHDVRAPGARLLFDTDMPILSAVVRQVVPATYTRQEIATSPPYGLPGARMTRFTQTSEWTFPTPLTYLPICQIGYTSTIAGVARSYDGSFRGISYEATTTGITVRVVEDAADFVDYTAPPVHRITVLNVARPL